MQQETLNNYELLKKIVESKLNITKRISEELNLLSDAPSIIIDNFLKAYQHVVVNNNEQGNFNESDSEIAYQLGITKAKPKNDFHYPVFAGNFPDYDVDFANPDLVKDYIKEKYGKEHVINIATYSRYKVKSLLKELCRVVTDNNGDLLVSFDIINELNKKLPFKIDNQIAEDIAEDEAHEIDGEEESSDEEIFSNKDIILFGQQYPKIFEHFKTLYGQPRHRSTHAAGVVITPEEARNSIPLARIKNAISSENVEGQGQGELGSLGFIKIDILGLKTLNMLDTCNRLIMKHYNLTEGQPSPCACYKQGIKCETNYLLPFKFREGTGEKLIDLVKVCKNIPKIYKRLTEGQTEGVFQFEPDGVSSYMNKFEPKNELDLALITAAYRPGLMDLRLNNNGEPIDIDDAEFNNGIPGHIMLLKRRKNQSPIIYPSEKVKSILEKTSGLAVFQESLSQMIMALTGKDFGYAEKIRKFLTKVKPELIKTDPETIRKINNFFEQFKKDSLNNGCTIQEINAVWNMILPFARYGFNCISGDTLIERPGANQFQNSPYITIRELFNAQNSESHWGKKIRYGRLNLLQMDEDNIIRPGHLKEIFYTGNQKVFKITTETNKSIKATAEHLFLTPEGYKKLSDLKINSFVITKGLKNYRNKVFSLSQSSRPAKGGKYKGGFKTGEENPAWKDGRKANFATNVTIVKNRANNHCEHCDCELQKNTKDEKNYEIAHIKLFHELNNNYDLYNNPENMLMLCMSCHRKMDYELGVRKKRWTRGIETISEKIISIEYCGIEDTYDIEMNTNQHNFIANDFVVHNCAHAVSYALISYQTAFCRILFPKEYLTSLMYHNVGVLVKGHLKIIDYIRTAQNLNFIVEKPDINKSKINFDINDDGNISAGLLTIKGVGEKASESIIANREEFGNFTSIEDFLERKIEWRVVSIKVLKLLTHSGTFDSISPNRQLTWLKIQLAKGKVKAKDLNIIDLGIGENGKKITEIHTEDYTKKEKIKQEREAFGFLFEDKITKNKTEIDEYKNLITMMSAQKNKDATIGTINEIKVMQQKNGKDYARISVTTTDGQKEQWLIFAHIWGFFENKIESGETYLCLGKRDLERKDTFKVDTINPLEEIMNLS